MDIKAYYADLVVLLKGLAKQPFVTVQGFKSNPMEWKDVLTSYLIPFYSVIFGLKFVFSVVFSSGPFMASMKGLAYEAVITTVLLFLVPFIFKLMAKPFGGMINYSNSFIAYSFTSIPVALIGLITTLTPIGALFLLSVISLASMIALIYFHYKFLKILLETSINKMKTYYVVTSVITVIALYIIMIPTFSMTPGIYSNGTMIGEPEDSYSSTYDGGDSTSFMNPFGGIMAGYEYIEQAERDQYTPPSNGKLTTSQVEQFITFKKKTQEIQNKNYKDMEKNEAKHDEGMSFSEQMKATRKLMELGTTEARVVKTGGGNWAEYSWIEEKLRAAIIFPEASPSNAHNHALYQRHQSHLDALL